VLQSSYQFYYSNTRILLPVKHIPNTPDESEREYTTTKTRNKTAKLRLSALQ